jgi:hypothetical protein
VNTVTFKGACRGVMDSADRSLNLRTTAPSPRDLGQAVAPRY